MMARGMTAGEAPIRDEWAHRARPKASSPGARRAGIFGPMERMLLRFWLPIAVAVALTVMAAVSLAGAQDAPLPVKAGDLAVEAAWGRATPPGGRTGAIYVTVSNAGTEADRLVSAETPASNDVMLHRTEMEGEVAKMRHAEHGFPVEPGGSLTMRPRGDHIMLMSLNAPLKEGESVPLTLVFERAGRVELTASIGPIGASGPDGHMAGSGGHMPAHGQPMPGH